MRNPSICDCEYNKVCKIEGYLGNKTCYVKTSFW